MMGSRFFMTILLVLITNQILRAFIVTSKYKRIDQDFPILSEANFRSNDITVFCSATSPPVCQIQLGNNWRLISYKHRNFHCCVDAQKEIEECEFSFSVVQNMVMDLIGKGDDIFIFRRLNRTKSKAAFEKKNGVIAEQHNTRISTSADMGYSEGYVAFLHNAMHTFQVFNLKSSEISMSCKYNPAKYHPLLTQLLWELQLWP